tara:strand:+ start:346 stop:804 length:459 start_codon:yes stop_codon:yes gene_type:complete
MAFAILNKTAGVARPLIKLASTDAGIDDVIYVDRSNYNIVDISDTLKDQLIREEKVIQSYDGNTLEVVDNADTWLEQSSSILQIWKDNLLAEHDKRLNKSSTSESFKTTVTNSKNALEALDLSTLGTFSYSPFKRLSELDPPVTNILSSLEV